MPDGCEICFISQESQGLQEFSMDLKIQITVSPEAYGFLMVQYDRTNLYLDLWGKSKFISAVLPLFVFSCV